MNCVSYKRVYIFCLLSVDALLTEGNQQYILNKNEAADLRLPRF